jgi:hypothetical protein
MPVIPAWEKLRQKDHEFKASLGYVVRPTSKREREGERGGRREREGIEEEGEREREKKRRGEGERERER